LADLDAAPPTDDRIVELPVCYCGELAPDLEEVARHANLSSGEVVTLHTATLYTVQMIGFTPGFPYLAGLDARLAVPRRAEPRLRVPAGSVGIGGEQTGVYPMATPGGWNLIGATPLSLFDPAREPAALLRIGDRVRFIAISRGEYDAMRRQ
jgi:inhibitor of KinA